MKALFVGDPHVVVSEMADAWKLVELVKATAVKEGVDHVVFLGDQYHHHGIVHLEVMDFWQRAIDYLLDHKEDPLDRMVDLWHTGEWPGTTLSQALGMDDDKYAEWMVGRAPKSKLKLWLMVGNHDKPGNGRQDINALMAHKGKNPRLYIVDEPMKLDSRVLLVPHQDHDEDFVRICQEFEWSNTVVCHQTFNGAIFENGFYAPTGIDLNLVPQAMVISGHIHAPQRFGKVWYLGAPRWRTASDANVDRNLWVLDFDDQGQVTTVKPIPTGDTCRRIWDVTDEENGLTLELMNGEALPEDRYDGKKDDVRVTLRGSSEYLKDRRPQLEKAGFRVRTICTDEVKKHRVKESEGVSTAFRKFTDTYQPRHGTSKEVLLKLVGERLSNGA